MKYRIYIQRKDGSLEEIGKSTESAVQARKRALDVQGKKATRKVVIHADGVELVGGARALDKHVYAEWQACMEDGKDRP